MDLYTDLQTSFCVQAHAVYVYHYNNQLSMIFRLCCCLQFLHCSTYDSQKCHLWNVEYDPCDIL